uniref:Uncharacterized protein n=1 Tax=Lepeophtheirus salmonis TaxID=72036 RepID=A0A0K2V7N0_LEPSM
MHSASRGVGASYHLATYFKGRTQKSLGTTQIFEDMRSRPFPLAVIGD